MKKIVITDNDVFIGDKQILKNVGIVPEEEFKNIGRYKVLNMSKKDIEFVRDKTLLENAIQTLFRKKVDLSLYILIIQVFTMLILLGKK